MNRSDIANKPTALPYSATKELIADESQKESGKEKKTKIQASNTHSINEAFSESLPYIKRSSMVSTSLTEFGSSAQMAEKKEIVQISLQELHIPANAMKAESFFKLSRPFVFFIDPILHKLSIANDVLVAHKSKEFGAQIAQQKAPSFPNYELCYQANKTSAVRYLGNTKQLESDSFTWGLIGSLCQISTAPLEEFFLEDDLGAICIASYLFDTGRIVQEDKKISSALAFSDNKDKRRLGFSSAAQFAAEEGDGPLFDYALTHGANPIHSNDSNEDTVLDILARKKDFLRLREITSTLDPTNHTYYLERLLEFSEVTNDTKTLQHIQSLLIRR